MYYIHLVNPPLGAPTDVMFVDSFESESGKTSSKSSIAARRVFFFFVLHASFISDTGGNIIFILFFPFPPNDFIKIYARIGIWGDTYEKRFAEQSRQMIFHPRFHVTPDALDALLKKRPRSRLRPV